MTQAEKKLPEGLEEAAENIYKTPFGTRAEDFIAGAEWQKSKMLEDAIEGRVGQSGFHNSIYIKEPEWCDTLDKFNNGDKVRVIIIKEDK